MLETFSGFTSVSVLGSILGSALHSTLIYFFSSVSFLVFPDSNTFCLLSVGASLNWVGIIYGRLSAPKLFSEATVLNDFSDAGSFLLLISFFLAASSCSSVRLER